MKGNDIAVRKQLFQGHIFYKLFQGIVLIHIVSDYFHAKAPANAAHSGADFSGANDACGFLVEVESHKSAQTEIIFSDFVIGLVQPAIAGQSQGHGMFGHSFGRISGDTHDTYAIFFGGLQIHIVEAGTAHQQEPDSFLMKNIQCCGSYIGVYKSAYCVKALGKRSGSRVQIRFDIFNGNIGKFTQGILERFFVIVFGVEKKYFHS